MADAPSNIIKVAILEVGGNYDAYDSESYNKAIHNLLRSDGTYWIDMDIQEAWDIARYLREHNYKDPGYLLVRQMDLAAQRSTADSVLAELRKEMEKKKVEAARRKKKADEAAEKKRLKQVQKQKASEEEERKLLNALKEKYEKDILGKTK